MLGFIIFIVVCYAGYHFINSYSRLNDSDYSDEAGHHMGVIILAGIALFIIMEF